MLVVTPLPFSAHQVLTTMQSKLFKDAGPQPPVPSPPPYRVQVRSATSGFVPRDNNPVKIPTWDEVHAEERESRTAPSPRTSTEGFVKQKETLEQKRRCKETFEMESLYELTQVEAAQVADMDGFDYIEGFTKKEETPKQKRKRKGTTSMQDFHELSQVDAFGAADMDDIDTCEPFKGFDFAASDAYNRSSHSNQQAHSTSGLSHGNGMSEDHDLSESLSGHTLVPDAFAASYPVTTHPYPEGTSHFYGDSIDQNNQGGFHTSGYDDAGQYNHNGVRSTYYGNVGQPYYGSGRLAYNDGSGMTYNGAGGITYNDGFDLDHQVDAGRLAAGLSDGNQVDRSYEPSAQGAVHGQNQVSASPFEESEFAASESESERPRKVPKLNKDGAPRKPRQPRAKLLKWTDDDWKNVLLGIVWACGEIGLQIPFEQAARVVGETCTAGALQQALLKLRAKQIAEGYRIPSLRMAWKRKTKHAAPEASQEPEANRRYKGSMEIVLRRAYKEEDRRDLARPYKWKKPSRKTKSSQHQSPANIKQETTDDTPTHPQTGAVPGYGHGYQTSVVACDNGFFPTMLRSIYDSPPEIRFGHHTGHLQGMVIGEGEAASLFATEDIEQYDSVLADANDDIFSTE